MRKATYAVLWLVLTIGALHLFVIEFPTSSTLVGDEHYYVPSALAMLNGTKCSAGIEVCNLEHPPLAKGFIALGISLFGDNSFGWRIFNVLFGLLCISLVYLLSKNLFATVLLGLDSMIFAQSGIGVLDIPMLFFLLLGFVLYFREKYVLSGVVLALAFLSKETAVLGIAGLLVYHLVYGRQKLKGFAYISAVTMFFGLLGLQVYDSLFTTLPTVFNHLAYMLQYGSTLKGNSWCAYAAVCPNGPYLNPLNWITAYFPPGYYTYFFDGHSIGWRGISTLPVAWFGIIGLLTGIKKPELRFPSIWFSFGYVPYLFLWIDGRVTYPYYLIPVIPALCIAAASVHPKIKEVDFTNLYRSALLLGSVLWFIATFPLL